MRRRIWAQTFVAAGLAGSFSLSYASGAQAADEPASDRDGRVQINALEVLGAKRTDISTFEELLPRRTPNLYAQAELREFKRRVSNLQLFDVVEVEISGQVLRITVREKFSISPIVDLSTGKTLRDLSATLGAIENNIGGAGTRLGAYAKYSERGPQFAVWLTEHSYHPTRWQKEVEVFYQGSGFRFAEVATNWQRTRLGGDIEVKTPYSYHSALRYEFVMAFYRERLTLVEGGAAPHDGYYIGTASELIWDRYSWNDIAPHGFRASVELRPGVFVGAAEPRYEARVEVLGAVPLGTNTVLAYRAATEGVNAGNVNHSVLIGSQRGVRGLPDTLYRDQLHGFANVELRHAFQLAPRWYLQPVAFVDAASFLAMNAAGTPTRWRGALATGLGARLIPTILTKTLLRVDVARLFLPSAEWGVQLGIDQYF